jgi:hypothetical protein
MNIALNAELSPAAGDGHRGFGSRNIFRTLLLTSTLLSGGLIAEQADAALLYPLVVTTTGTVTSGTETGGLFGLGASGNLAGQAYTLSVEFAGLGPNYTATGSFASDFESFPGIPGIVSATLNGQTITVPLTANLASTLEESLVAGFGSFDAANQGNNGSSTGAFVDVSQDLVCGSSNSCVPAADLQTAFQYTLQSGDFGTDQYTYDCAGFPSCTGSASFTGTEATMTFQVPEPDSWALLAAGLLGLGMLVRWRRA